MTDPFALGDELGPAKVIHVRQPALGRQAILVVDNVAAGPSIGGLRMAADVTLEECARLARAMTLKNAAAGLAHGGGKSVLVGDPKMDIGRKQQLIRAFADALCHETDYIFGPDMGTDETCMAWIRDEIGRAVGLPRELGGIALAYAEGNSFRGTTRLSLNNNLQDPSQVHQAIAYRVFNAAGVAAPRCTFARVTVNGKSLGLYSHVEPVESAFLKRHFKGKAKELLEGG